MVEHIPRFGSDLMAVTSSRMLKGGVIPQYKTMKNVHGAFSGAFSGASHSGSDTMVDDHHLLVRLEEEQKVPPKKTPLKLVAKKVVEEVGQGREKTESSSEFEDVFDVNNSPLFPRGLLTSKLTDKPLMADSSFQKKKLEKFQNRHQSSSFFGATNH